MSLPVAQILSRQVIWLINTYLEKNTEWNTSDLIKILTQILPRQTEQNQESPIRKSGLQAKIWTRASQIHSMSAKLLSHDVRRCVYDQYRKLEHSHYTQRYATAVLRTRQTEGQACPRLRLDEVAKRTSPVRASHDSEPQNTTTALLQWQPSIHRRDTDLQSVDTLFPYTSPVEHYDI
jgi:hypothetical protein